MEEMRAPLDVCSAPPDTNAVATGDLERLLPYEPSR
jgi:hypothetical protein